MRDRSELVERLAAARREHCFPTDLRPRTQAFLQQTLSLLFPHFADAKSCAPDALPRELDLIASALTGLVKDLGGDVKVVDVFIDGLAGVWRAARDDADALFHGDPAATSTDEVILAYPGFYATLCHRLAHVLYGAKLTVLPRLITELARERTGVDIHPGATIGRRFMIDHGSGVVIGETAVIGNGVKVYQGVTLGALTVEKQAAGNKRHPTLGDHVVVYANATILGGDTLIGHDSIIAGNAFLTKSVPPFSLVDRRGDARPRPNAKEDSVDFSI